MQLNIEAFERDPKDYIGELPLDRLSPGTQFVIPASESKRFATFRTSIWRFNKMYGSDIRANKQHDGSLRVWKPIRTEQEQIVGKIDQDKLASALEDL